MRTAHEGREDAMGLQGKAKLLRIFIGELDKAQGLPLYEAIVQAARKQGLAGTTVLRGIESFGAASVVHTAKILRLSEDLPLVIEIVDSEEKVAAFLPELDRLMEEGRGGGLVTLEAVDVIRYFSRKG
jgi:hypothetical protein